MLCIATILAYAMKPLGDINQVRARLLLRGFGSVATWAERNGYVPATVRRSVYVWGSRGDKEPHGGISRQIMRDLRRDIG